MTDMTTDTGGDENDRRESLRIEDEAPLNAAGIKEKGDDNCEAPEPEHASLSSAEGDQSAEDEANKKVEEEEDGGGGGVTGRPISTRKKTAKFKKHPNAPKRFRSAFIIFSQQRHKELRAKLNAEGGEIDTMNIAGQISEEWRSLSPEPKAKWEEMARQDKERYQHEKERYAGPWKVRTNLRKPKDPNSPKKPVPAYFAFSNERRQDVKNQNPSATNGEVSRMLSKMWKEAPVDVRQVYVERESREREVYTEKMIEWKKNRQSEAAENATAVLAQFGDGKGDRSADDEHGMMMLDQKKSSPRMMSSDLATFRLPSRQQDNSNLTATNLTSASYASRPLDALRRSQQDDGQAVMGAGGPFGSPPLFQQHSAHHQLGPQSSTSRDSTLLTQLLLGTQAPSRSAQRNQIPNSSDGDFLLMRHHASLMAASTLQQQQLSSSNIGYPNSVAGSMWGVDDGGGGGQWSSSGGSTNMFGGVNAGYLLGRSCNPTASMFLPQMQQQETNSIDPSTTANASRMNDIMQLLLHRQQSSESTTGIADHGGFLGINNFSGGRSEIANNNNDAPGELDSAALLRRILVEQRQYHRQGDEQQQQRRYHHHGGREQGTLSSSGGGFSSPHYYGANSGVAFGTDRQHQQRTSNTVAADQEAALQSFLLRRLGSGRGGGLP